MYKPLTTLERQNGAEMDRDKWMSNTSYWMPRHIVESAWLEHAPFAFWLVDAIRPRSIVELGTHNGFSYFTFCEAIRRLGLPTRAFALDSWEGDDQAGFYGHDVYDDVAAVNDSEYASFSTLLRGYFDDSLGSIADASVDLLHIDGRHGYEDVRHDFGAWLPKLTDRGVVIFHDTAEKQAGFGVWQFWAEVSEQYPSFEFVHGHGLGVLAVGSEAPTSIVEFINAATENPAEVRSCYEELGATISRQFELEAAPLELNAMRGRLQSALELAETRAGETERTHTDLLGALAQIQQLRNSSSWRVTKPLRAASDVLRGRKS